MVKRFREFFEWLVSQWLLLRGAYHNRIAWAAVLGGLGIAALSRFEVLFTHLDMSVEINPWTGVAIAGAGLVYHLGFSVTERALSKNTFKEEDRERWKNNRDLWSQKFIDNYLDEFHWHAVRQINYEKSYQLRMFINSKNDLFLDEEVQGKAYNLAGAMVELEAHYGAHSMPSPSGHQVTFTELHPRNHVQEADEIYERYMDFHRQHDHLIDVVENAYNDFVRTAKIRLSV